MEIPRVANWLSQFDIADKYLAEHMLRKMRYVGFEEVEQWLQHALLDLLAEIEKEFGKEAVAIFPVAKPFIHEFNKDKETKQSNDSSGRIAHSIKNLERRLPNHIELTPRHESMKARKVRHIIFIDDFIGTGDRFVKSWRQIVSRRVKAWCSLGWCKIWVLAYAGHESGVSRIVNTIRTISRDRLRVNLLIKRSFIAENKYLEFLTIKYGHMLREGRSGLGYGALLSPVIFQYGCPNNVPSIFWSSGKYGKRKWKPLFPERSVPNDLYPIFNIDLSEFSSAEELWMVGHYKLALEFLERIDDFRGNHQLLVVLAFLSKNKEIIKIRNVLVLSDEEFQSILSELLKYGLVDTENRVTNFGRDILKRGEKGNKVIANIYKGSMNFYPKTFSGFQREV